MSWIHNVVHWFAPLTANCRNFSQRWQAAGGGGEGGVPRRWIGEWKSEATGHHGALRCVVEPVGATRWRMHFRAEYSGILRACYSTDFNVVPESGRWTFEGAFDLGRLAGGRFEYGGHARPEEMICSYRSSRDHGEFRLTPVGRDPKGHAIRQDQRKSGRPAGIPGQGIEMRIASSARP